MPILIRPDLTTLLPPLRPLHGVNNGPFNLDGLIDTSEFFRQAAFPDVRLHDCLYPARDIVDINAVFPDFSADPTDPASYDFARTDHYLKSIAATGASITYRLGYAIDHHPLPRYCAPPSDFAKWAQVCLHIARHYTAGWSNGFANLVARFEIWNEPDNNPGEKSHTWCEKPEKFNDLYEITAKTVKKHLPNVPIGGPALTSVHGPFPQNFLAHCQNTRSPLDFLSWHLYTPDPAALPAAANHIRNLLNQHNFHHTLSHLTEWHYIPENMDWQTIMTPVSSTEKRLLHAEMNGPQAAAFTAAALLQLQDAPIDMANFYTADTLPFFGLFDPFGAPHPPYHALQSFHQLQSLPHRLSIPNPLPSNILAAATACPKTRGARLLLVNYGPSPQTIELEVPLPAACRVVSGEGRKNEISPVTRPLLLPGWAVALVDFSFPIL